MSRYLQSEEKTALELDARDPLSSFREKFALPTDSEVIYFCNNSLGLPAKTTFERMQGQIQRWADFGVEGWSQGETNWYSSFDLPLRKALSHILGAKTEEVVIMNSLTVNLHLLLVSFYQPTRTRFKILMDSPVFPSDLYAIKSHLRYHGLNPEQVLIMVEPRQGEHLLRQEDIEEVLMQEGDTIALVFLSSVNFLTGQALDMSTITKLAQAKGCLVGFDIAHAAGNVLLELHRWKVDFAVGCSYKFLCSGPGGPGIAYVHTSHHNKNYPRYSGWWGNDPKKRFQMHLESEFIPYEGAYSWQVSTPSILALTPFLASLELFTEAKIHNLRMKSELQTAFLLELLNKIPHSFEIITPKNPKERGGQLSLLIQQAEKCLQILADKGVICDFRPPNIIRVTPSPFYNTFHEIYQFACRFADTLSKVSFG